MVKPYGSNFLIITVIFSGLKIFQIFTVQYILVDLIFSADAASPVVSAGQPIPPECVGDVGQSGTEGCPSHSSQSPPYSALLKYI